jgi:DNA-binding NarL/FixJ family response regulator
MHTIDVMVVEDEPATRAHLVAAAGSHARLRVSAQAGTLAHARAALERRRPHVLLVDLDLPDGSALALIRDVCARDPQVDVMVVSVFGDERSVIAAIEAGAGGYLLKDGDWDDLADSILRLVDGQAPISPAIAAHLVRRLRPARSSAQDLAPGCALTARELEVLELVSKGLTYDEIGRALELRYNTVASYTKTIYRKLAVQSRGEAVFEARQLGLLA